MKRRAFFLIGISVFLAALSAFAATSCPAPQVLSGSNCTLTNALGWLTAGNQTATVITIFVPPNASAPVDFEVTGLTSSLGSSYHGYLGFMGNEVGQPGGGVLTLTDIVAGAPEAIGQVPPGALIQFQITKVCWDPTCTAPAPAGAVPNMFGLQSIMSSPNNTDIGITPSPQGTIQFLNGNQITFETQVSAARMNAPNVIIPGISIGATPASRYVLNGTAYTFPFDAVSISNLNNPGAISGTAILQDLNGNNVAMGTIPAVPSGGSAGYLVVAAPGGTQGLFAANTTLPATPDGIFHGTLILSFTGQTAAGFTLVAAQEFAGNAMLNLRVFGSPVP